MFKMQFEGQKRCLLKAPIACLKMWLSFIRISLLQMGKKTEEVPLIYDTNGVMSKECENFHTGLALKLSKDLRNILPQ